MSCERHRSEIRDVALGAAASGRLEAHLAVCPACRAMLENERRRLAEIDGAIGDALAVEPSPSLLPRVLEVASRRLAEPRSRLVWLLPVAASLVALAVLVPLSRHTSPDPGTRVPPSPLATASVSEVEVPATASRPESRDDPRGAPAGARPRPRHPAPRVAKAASEPEVIVPPGGEAALRRYVQAIRHRRVGQEVVLGLGPDPIDWSEPPSMLQRPGAAERFPDEPEGPTSQTEALPLGD